MNRRIVTRAKRLAALTPGALLLFSFLGTAASPLGIWSSHLERMSHFRFGWIVLLLLLLAFFLKRRQRLPAIASGILLAGQRARHSVEKITRSPLITSGSGSDKHPSDPERIASAVPMAAG